MMLVFVLFALVTAYVRGRSYEYPPVPFLNSVPYTYRYYYTYQTATRSRNAILVQMRWNESYVPAVRSWIDLSEFDGINWRVTKIEKNDVGPNKKHPQAILTLETSSKCAHALAFAANSRNGGKWRYSMGDYGYSKGYLPKGNDIRMVKGSYQKAMTICRQTKSCRAVTFFSKKMHCDHCPPPAGTVFMLKSKVGQGFPKMNPRQPDWFTYLRMEPAPTCHFTTFSTKDGEQELDDEEVEELNAHQNPFVVLNAHPSDGQAGVKRAYRRLSVLFHPDKCAACPRRMRRRQQRLFTHMSEAYKELMRSAPNGPNWRFQQRQYESW